MKKFLHAIFYLVFWLWNLTFLTLVYAAIVPAIGIFLIEAVLDGLIPFEFLLTLLLLAAIPTLCTILGVWRLRKAPLRLIRLFYGVEAPLFLLCLLRLFLLRELTPASMLMIGTFLLCILAFALNLFYGFIRRHRILAWVQLFCHTLMLFVGLYVATLILFYAIPIAFALLRVFLRFDWFSDLLFMLTHAPWWGFLSLVSFSISTTLFLAMPTAFITFYLYAGARIWQLFAAQYGKKLAWLGSGGAIILWIGIFLLVQQQPQRQAFRLLNVPPQNESARRELLAQTGIIRKGLVNAYLSPYRYLSPRSQNTHIREIYHEVLGLERSTAQIFQGWYNHLTSPFLYDGSSSDNTKAAKLYAEFFDTPIQRGERRAIQHAIQSTYDRDEVKAGLLNINQETVWLAKQQITVESHGDWANVELYEVYENQTPEQQEVFYSFSLPESAVITGLWLGESADRENRYVFQVSPRGTAQQVYNAQVRRRVDPALLEQVGPRHYRLRAFPVPARLPERQRKTQPQPRLHLWLTYKLMRQDAVWQMPHLGEKRNVFWTKKTECNYNGYLLKHPGDSWLPAIIQANQSVRAESRHVKLPGGFIITAKPLKPEDYLLPQGKHIAILVDSSYSMMSRIEHVQTTLKWLQGNFAQKNDIDVYISGSKGIQPRRIDDIHSVDPEVFVFYGSVQFKDILRQFEQLRGDTTYDAILLVTDEGSYELSDNDKNLPSMPAPLWMVHVGGLPRAYDDITLQAIQKSGGGVSTDIQEVLQRMATTEASGSTVVSVVDGYAWFLDRNDPQEFTPESEELTVTEEETDFADHFEPLAVRQLILRLSQEMDLNALVHLDFIHTIAQRFKIVSPYSSMIVLVDEAQREALKQAEAQSDRFDREVEAGQETLTKPFNPLHAVPAVPEPSTIVLFVIGFLGILLLRHKRS